MRGVLLSLLITMTALAGCLGGSPELPESEPELVLDEIKVPEGAELIEDEIGAILEWIDVEFPFQETVTIPGNVSLVRLEGDLDGSGTIRTNMWNADTDRRRCNVDSVDAAWNVQHSGSHQCSGLAAIDPPGSEWVIRVTGPVNAETGVSAKNEVRLVYETAPLDGPVSHLDLDRLSMPTHDLLETTGQYVESFDGTELWVETTLPEGEGPFPTVIAASPYNGQYGRLPDGGSPAMWGYWTHDWAKRGYAAINVDVRGFGLSGGCVEVWGENEQRDQSFIVDWVADQSWSDGNVGFYGQSYVGTTPVAAAVQAPEALKAIIAVAPVINAYEDWHYGGVPNGENTLSPVAYQVLTDVPPDPDPDNPEPWMDPVTVATNLGKGLCDPTLVARANDPRAVYDDYYEQRDFKLRADQVEAAVLFTQGFEDTNVKSAMIPDWFNGIEAPKLGIFGHWVHQHPPRADSEVLFLAWMDQYVKGKDLGLDQVPPVLVQNNVGSERQADAWPTPGLDQTHLWPDWAAGEFHMDESAANGAELSIGPGAPVAEETLEVAYEVPGNLTMSGAATLQMRGTLQPGGNAFLSAELYDRHDGDMDLITWGMFNLAHDETHQTWTPVTGPVDVDIRFLPTEYVFQEGHELVIRLTGVHDDPTAFPGLNVPAGIFTIGDHSDGVGALVLDSPSMDAYTGFDRTAWH